MWSRSGSTALAALRMTSSATSCLFRVMLKPVFRSFSWIRQDISTVKRKTLVIAYRESRRAPQRVPQNPRRAYFTRFGRISTIFNYSLVNSFKSNGKLASVWNSNVGGRVACWCDCHRRHTVDVCFKFDTLQRWRRYCKVFARFESNFI